jgi:DNA-directed RNA polymerase sigma subunit (sigma70/sigma32)
VDLDIFLDEAFGEARQARQAARYGWSNSQIRACKERCRRMKHLVIHTWGLRGNPPATLTQVCTDLGMKVERGRQVLAKAMEELRACAAESSFGGDYDE